MKHKEKRMRNKSEMGRWGSAVIVATLFVLAAQGTCWAIGGQHYGHGSEDFVSGAVPPPGFYFLNYMSLTNKERLKGEDGDTVPGEFDADVFVNLTRWIWSTPLTFWDGKANVVSQVLIPWYKTDVDLGPGFGGGPNTDTIQFDDSGMGDIIVTPVALAFHPSPNFHFVTALDFIAPTGHYESDDPSTQILNRNHWTFESVLAATYLTHGFDFSSKFMYDFHTKNDEFNGDQELAPGQEFHADYAIGYAPKNIDGLRFGINGFSHWQTTNDEIDGVNQPSSTKTVLHGIGPAVKWWPNKGRFSFTLKHIFEYGAENLPEGQTTWFKTVFVL